MASPAGSPDEALSKPVYQAAISETPEPLLSLTVELFRPPRFSPMAHAPSAQAPSPTLFFETMNAYQRSAALEAALDLDLFTAIGEGNKSPASIARRCKSAERGARILCDYLTVAGFLTKQGSE